MKIAIAALLFAERNMKINHKKSPVFRSLYFIGQKSLISEASNVDKIVKIKS